jgi:two-component system phosphate regulon sensor histidine kinase PhoR
MWWRSAFALMFLFLVSAIVALAWGGLAGLSALCLGLAVYLLHTLRRVDRLAQALMRLDLSTLADDLGAWGEIRHQLLKMQERNRRGKSRLASLLKRFERAARAIPDGIVMLNASDQMDWVNPAAERLLGLDDTRDRGQFIRYLIRSTAFTQYLDTRDYSQPLTLRGPLDRELFLSIQIVPFGDKLKILLVRDITNLERVDIMRRDFVANVSHELRTPLTVVGGFLESFADVEDVSLDDLRRYIGLMLEQTRRMQRLLDDLLTLSRLESNDNPLQEVRIDMAEFARALLDEANSLSRGRHAIDLRMESAKGLLGNPHELRSAFSNLISNAVRYTPEGGGITLGWEEKDGDMRFSVTDSGDGIDPMHLPRLTERFYRVDKSRSRETGGTGLGLAIVKHVLTRHGAHLEIDSQVGKGSRFSAVFPASRAVAEAGAEAEVVGSGE